ncbi:hypothetical protein HDU76_007628 [Blyttiomyces sp. JEL0837]|nr:hypothetical protein HDU76_007628 [Blyttiomyces sp. JEL0837]
MYRIPQQQRPNPSSLYLRNGTRVGSNVWMKYDYFKKDIDVLNTVLVNRVPVATEPIDLVRRLNTLHYGQVAFLCKTTSTSPYETHCCCYITFETLESFNHALTKPHFHLDDSFGTALIDQRTALSIRRVYTSEHLTVQDLIKTARSSLNSSQNASIQPPLLNYNRQGLDYVQPPVPPFNFQQQPRQHQRQPDPQQQQWLQLQNHPQRQQQRQPQQQQQRRPEHQRQQQQQQPQPHRQRQQQAQSQQQQESEQLTVPSEEQAAPQPQTPVVNTTSELDQDQSPQTKGRKKRRRQSKNNRRLARERRANSATAAGDSTEVQSSYGESLVTDVEVAESESDIDVEEDCGDEIASGMGVVSDIVDETADVNNADVDGEKEMVCDEVVIFQEVAEECIVAAAAFENAGALKDMVDKEEEVVNGGSGGLDVEKETSDNAGTDIMAAATVVGESVEPEERVNGEESSVVETGEVQNVGSYGSGSDIDTLVSSVDGCDSDCGLLQHTGDKGDNACTALVLYKPVLPFFSFQDANREDEDVADIDMRASEKFPVTDDRDKPHKDSAKPEDKKEAKATEPNIKFPPLLQSGMYIVDTAWDISVLGAAFVTRMLGGGYVIRGGFKVVKWFCSR